VAPEPEQDSWHEQLPRGTPSIGPSSIPPRGAAARGNHDGSPLKGWLVCTARAGTLTRRFVAVPDELMRAGRG
jgi:hypothetical protein